MMLFPIISSSTPGMPWEDQVKVYSEILMNWWSQWEIRVLVIISILFQWILAMYGNRRKSKHYWFRHSFFREPLLWWAYLVSDWVAGFALGVISNKLAKCPCTCNDTQSQEDINPSLMALWATLFLLQLGGPDNITAYALEDNELWLRHLVGLVAQTSVTAYIIFLSWNIQSPFSRLSILMLIIGFIKYAERIWSLYSASIKHRSSRISQLEHNEDQVANEYLEPKTMLRRFKFLFISFFTDVVLSNEYIERDRLHFQQMISFEEAFDVVKIELGLAYDVFYTKALVRYTIWGFISPFITCTGAVVLYVYCRASIGDAPDTVSVDKIFTYLLAIVILTSEATSLMYLALSSFTSRRLGARILGLRMMLFRFRNNIRGFKRETEQRPLIIQYDFLKLFKKNKSGRSNSSPRFGNLDISLDFKNANHCSELTNLMELIFDNLRQKSVTGTSSNKPNFRDHILEYDRSLQWASELEFQRTIILWHVATDICYYSDDNRDNEEYARYLRESKNLSEYMFYLLLECRYMLPVGSGLVTLHDTCFEGIQFLRTEGMLEASVDEAYQRLRQFQSGAGVRVDQSLLSCACGLAGDLLKRDRNQMWMFLAELWLEILGYAAANCSGNNHAQQLRRGGELLSQVWLLQAHFGVLEQFRVTEMRQDNQQPDNKPLDNRQPDSEQEDNHNSDRQNEELQGKELQVNQHMASDLEIEVER